MTEIAVEGVTKRFGRDEVAVEDVSFGVSSGEFFVIVGPSGCGKSTLLNVIVGLEPVTEGTIRVDGEVVNDLDPKDRNMAMVFQSYAIYPHMSVAENLAFPLRMAKLGEDEIRQKVRETAALLGVGELLDRKPGTLSGGERQRVAMGRALVREPRAFLMDEPLSNLDAELRSQMRAEIARLQRRLGITTLYVTHDQTEAMTLGDRIAVLREGVVEQIGTPKELYNEPGNVFVARFIGAPPMNLFPAKVHHRRLKALSAEIELSSSAAERLPAEGPLTVGVRPEHLSTTSAGSGAAGTGSNVVRAKTDVVEWLGSDLFVHVVTDRDERLVARLPPDHDAEPGSEIALTIDPDRLHFFDSGSGRRLPPSRGHDRSRSGGDRSDP